MLTSASGHLTLEAGSRVGYEPRGEGDPVSHPAVLTELTFPARLSSSVRVTGPDRSRG